jgi:hypothetical protein
LELKWEFQDGPHHLGSGKELPDFGALSACSIECRWIDLFTDVMAELNARLMRRYWVLDAEDVVWDISEIDLGRFTL